MRKTSSNIPQMPEDRWLQSKLQELATIRFQARLGKAKHRAKRQSAERLWSGVKTADADALSYEL
jgi:hypothetical protein